MGLDGVEMIMAVEEAFGVEFKDDELVKTVTPRMVGDLFFLKKVVMEQLALSESQYTEDARFVEDLGVG